jgi:hypothetical protein
MLSYENGGHVPGFNDEEEPLYESTIIPDLISHLSTVSNPSRISCFSSGEKTIERGVDFVLQREIIVPSDVFRTRHPVSARVTVVSPECEMATTGPRWRLVCRNVSSQTSNPDWESHMQTRNVLCAIACVDTIHLPLEENASDLIELEHVPEDCSQDVVISENSIVSALFMEMKCVAVEERLTLFNSRVRRNVECLVI